MRFRLSDADRVRLGCPEWITYDASRMTNREAIVLQKAGYDPPAKAIGEAWMAQFTEVGDDVYELKSIDYAVWTAMVWMALRRDGVKVDLDDLEFDVNDARSELGQEEPEVDEGKDPSTPPETSDG